MDMLNLSCFADRMAEAWPVVQYMAQSPDILSLTIMPTQCRHLLDNLRFVPLHNKSACGAFYIQLALTRWRLVVQSKPRHQVWLADHAKYSTDLALCLLGAAAHAA